MRQLSLTLEQRIDMKFTGTVKWFNDAKGYGFITMENGDNVFVHHTAIKMDGYRTLAEGQAVMFDITDGPKGKSATEVEAKK